MSTIPPNNLRRFLSQELNLSSKVLTDSLGTINRINIFSRISHSNELDSQNICKNIETTINSLYNPLTGKEKETVLKNLNAMKAKFSTSNDVIKAQNCSTTIDRVILKIKSSDQQSSPLRTTPVQARPTSTTAETQEPVVTRTSRKGHKQRESDASPSRPQTQRQVSLEPAAPKTDQKAQVVVTTKSQAVPPASSKTLRAVQVQDTNGAQKKLVDAISRMNKKVETTLVTSVQIAPNMDRIAKIEIGVKESDRKLNNFKRHLIYYRHTDKYYFEALILKNDNGFRTCGRTLVEATEIKEQIQKIKESGANDVGALLRERMATMGIGFKEQ